MSYRKVVEEAKHEITKWLDTYTSMNPDISIDTYEQDINELCELIIKKLEAGEHFERQRK